MQGYELYEQALTEAVEAANKAGSEWIKSRLIPGKMFLNETEHSVHIVDSNGNRINPMLDVCGGAYIELKDGRTKFAKFIKLKEGNNHVWSVTIPHKFRGWQDMGLKEVTISAALRVLKEQYGIKGLVFKSFVD